MRGRWFTDSVWRTAATLVALFASLFVLISSGTTGSGDAKVRYRVARALVRNHDVVLSDGDRGGYPGKAGRTYSLYGIGQSLLFALPEAAVVTACAVARTDCRAPVWEDVSIGLSSTFLLPFISAAGLGFLFLLLIELGFDTRVSGLTTLLVATATMLLPYAKFHQEENQLAALLYAALYFWARFTNHARPADAIAAAALCWLPLWFRLPGLALSLPVAGLIVAAAFRSPPRAARAAVLGVVLAGAVTLAWLMFYNHLRFGSATATGYVEAWRATGRIREDHRLYGDIATGLVGPFLHPSKALLIYSPVLILACKGAALSWHNAKARALTIAAIAALAISIAMPSSLRHWGGDHSWGPRYQVAGHALLLVCSAYFWQRWPSLGRGWRRVAIAVVIVGVLVQLLSLPFSFNLEYSRGLKMTSESDAPFFDVARSQLVLRVDSLARFSDSWFRVPPSVPDSVVAEYSIPALIPWKLGQRFGSTVWAASVVLWLIGVAGWCVWFFRVARQFGPPLATTDRGPHQ